MCRVFPGEGDQTETTVVPMLMDGEESVMAFIDGKDVRKLKQCIIIMI